MRTTLDLDEAVLAAGRALIQSAAGQDHRPSLGAAVSTLALRGLQARPPARRADGFPVVSSGNPAHVLTNAMVLEHQDD